MSRSTRLGPIAVVLGVMSGLHLLGLIAGGTQAAFLLHLLARSETAVRILRVALPILDASLAVLGIVAAVQTKRLVPGTLGRGRIGALGVISAIHYVPLAVFWGFGLSVVARAQRGGLANALAPFDLLFGVDPTVENILGVSGALTIVTGIVMLVATISSWFLLPSRLRSALWAVVDVALLVGFIWAVLKISLRVPEGRPDAWVLPSLRVAISTSFIVRCGVRLLPRLFGFVERIGARSLVAARHLRSSKSNFLAAIGALSILAVAVSSCMLTTVLSVMGGFRNDLKNKILGNSAHVVVDVEHGTFEGWGEVLDRIRSVEGVVAVSPYVSGEVMVTSASNLAGAELRGIDPATVDRVTDLRRNLRRGRMEYLLHPEQLVNPPHDEDRPTAVRLEPPRHDRPSRDTREIDDLLGLDHAEAREVLPGIIVGQELARSLRLYVGDDIEVVSPLGELGPAGPMPKTRSFRVAGVFYSGMYEYDMKYVYTTLETAQRFLNVGDAVSGIEIRVGDVERAPEVARRVRAAIRRPDLRVEDWQTRNRNLFGALALEKLAMFVTLGIAVMIAGFCVFGTLTLMVQEKGREVGILKAMGTSERSIIGIFLIEGLLIGVLGAASGLGLGFVAAFTAENFGIRLNPEVYYIDKLPVHVDPTEFTIVGIAAVIICLLATVFPAILASRLRPVDALRYE